MREHAVPAISFAVSFGHLNIPQQKEEPQRTQRDAKGKSSGRSPNGTGLLEKASGEKASLTTAEILGRQQVPLCSFVSFVVNRVFWRRLAVLCRALPLARKKLPWQDRFSGY
jgi:hypothetical protein